MRSRPGSEMTSSTSPVVWYSGGACMTLTFATFNAAHPPVSPLWNVERSEMKLTPKRAGPLSMSSCRNGELLVTPTAIGGSLGVSMDQGSLNLFNVNLTYDLIVSGGGNVRV